MRPQTEAYDPQTESRSDDEKGKRSDRIRLYRLKESTGLRGNQRSVGSTDQDAAPPFPQPRKGCSPRKVGSVRSDLFAATPERDQRGEAEWDPTDIVVCIDGHRFPDLRLTPQGFTLCSVTASGEEEAEALQVFKAKVPVGPAPDYR